ncbi:MAG: thioredoxin fold domain-containing protein [Capnocytophaga sp.]|nr:thioredoxin fold domain-containing protein [Capnocytophaga sp.]
MKRYIAVVALIISGIASVSAQEIKWMTMDEAVAAQKKSPKKIFMDVYTVWCGPCQMLDRNTFKNKDVAEYVNKNFYAVKFNGEGNEVVNYKGQKFENPNYDPARKNSRNGVHHFAAALGVQAYPTMMFFDEEANPIFPISGYLKPSQIELYLKLAANEDYKKFKTNDDFKKYQSEFKGSFKDN